MTSSLGHVITLDAVAVYVIIVRLPVDNIDEFNDL